ncbi:hypothetical protein FRC08_001038 [Ceratobasidium sp. 394]|nr:hypothetical protein FRC08_001038 [Ceratobasidium sp. 394]KAG9085427.1 hypothetical protein FS749_004427 [Ceratobasidium sp. UAMH 11750]
MVGRAAIKIHNCDQYYFFSGEMYARIDCTPDQRDSVVYGPAEFLHDWKSLRDAGFSQIDAILPIPDQINEAFVFSGTKFCQIRYLVDHNDDELLVGADSITSRWSSLANADFHYVDGAIVVPGTTNQAYFFSGSRFCRVAFSPNSDQPDELLEGPYELCERWPKLGFRAIDNIISSQYTTSSSFTNAYVFSGTQTARINLVPGGEVDIMTGPISASAYWPSLHDAGFY